MSGKASQLLLGQFSRHDLSRLRGLVFRMGALRALVILHCMSSLRPGAALLSENICPFMILLDASA